MTDLFNRDFALKIGAWSLDTREKSTPIIEDGVSKTTLAVDFMIEKTLAKEPNLATVTLYNLNPHNRKILADSVKPNLPTVLPVSIEAGYVGARELIFIGDITVASSNHEGTKWITKIEASDGGTKYRSKRFSKSFGPGAMLPAIMTEVVGAYGIGPGNLFETIIANTRGLQVYYKGVVVEGRISDILDHFLCSMGFTWSIQDGQIQVLHPGKPNFEPAVFLNPSSGLVGSPEVGEKGKVTGRSLLQGSIRPGRRVVIESSSVSGTFVIEKASYRGNTAGNDWYVDFDAKPEAIAA